MSQLSIILLNIKKMAKSFICINFAFNINLLTNGNNSSLKFEIMAKQLYVASQRVL